MLGAKMNQLFKVLLTIFAITACEAASSSGSIHSSKVCAAFYERLQQSGSKINGKYFWQKPQNYCQGIPDEVVRIIDENDLGTLVDRLNFAFSDMLNRSPSNEIPWRELRFVLTDYAQIPWDFFSKNITAATYDKTIEELDKIITQLNSKAQHFEEEIRHNMQSLSHMNSQSEEELEAEIKKEMEQSADLSKRIDAFPFSQTKTPEYQELDKQRQELNQKLFRKRDELSHKTQEKKNISGIISHNIISSTKAKMWVHLFDARKQYLIKNKPLITSMLVNYYQLTPNGMNRYTDDLSKSWLDLMPSDYYFGADSPPHFDGKMAALRQQFKVLPRNPKYEPLRQAIDVYNQMPKTQNLNKRAAALKRIAQLAASLKQNDEDSDLFEKIISRANLKAAYIAKLKNISDEAFYRSVRSAPFDGRGRSYYEMSVAVKSDQLVDIDPEKRNGHGFFYPDWSKLVKQNPNTPHYFIWLESQSNLDTFALNKDIRHTFIRPELKRVNFKNGYGFNEIFRGKDSGHVLDGSYVYNIGEDGELYISPAFKTLQSVRTSSPVLFKKQGLGRELNHDTLLGGANILCAGIVEFHDGRIKHIDTNSGHYKPEMISDLRPALAELLKRHPGAISPETTVMNYHGQYKMPYSRFLTVYPHDVGERHKTFSEDSISLDQYNNKMMTLGANPHNDPLKSSRKASLKRIMSAGSHSQNRPITSSSSAGQ